MSRAITYDSLLVHYLARELHERLSARRLRGVRLDREHRRFTLELDDERLVWELHPARGWLRVVRDPDADPTAPGPGVGEGRRPESASLPVEAAEGWGGRRVPTQRRPRVRQVDAPPDERLLTIDIDAGGPDRASRFVVELMTNQWNVLALDPRGRILAALWSREAGGRDLRAGAEYHPPAGAGPRRGIEAPLGLDDWRALLGELDPADRPGTLVRTVAWTSPLVARAILGPRGEASLATAWERYRSLAERPRDRPQVLRVDGRPVPYPLPLPGLAGTAAVSLLAAFQRAAEHEAPGTLAPEVRTALEERLDRIRRRAERLHAEAESAPGRAAELRRRAHILMARLGDVEKGARTVELNDFEGSTITLELDPALTPAENAEALYDRAKKRERAARRLPDRVREAVAERNRLEQLLESLDSGEADPAAVAHWLAEVRPDEPSGEAGGERLPYRRFRSSGGLEIRVGRSGRANDDLTFHHASPDDIWLHARDAAGAHVILRWDDRDQNPPQRDLLEAAILAAVSSRARTSGTVPVDWTRRKYVRKPRKAPPGAVVPERVSTVFVEPDPAVEERLRVAP